MTVPTCDANGVVSG